MARVDVSTSSDLAPESAWKLACDLQRFGDWMTIFAGWRGPVPDKIGKGLLFISLSPEPQTREAAIAALDALRAELESKGASVKDGSWGYRLLVVDDPDGNQLALLSEKTINGA